MDQSASKTLLTSSQTAELVGVHSSTVKRWCDNGAMETLKTPGGHRRINLRDALDTARSHEISTFLDPFHPWEGNVWTAVTQIEASNSYKRFQSLALGWLIRGETDLLTWFLAEVGQRPQIPFTEFLDRGIRGFMSKVGEDWLAGRLAIGEEHMATQVVLEALLRLRPGWSGPRDEHAPDPSSRPVAVVGGVEGDYHELGALGVRVLLERNGWRVYYLGANVPAEELSRIQRAQGANLVCISGGPGTQIPELQRVVSVLGQFSRPDHPFHLALGGAFPDLSDRSLPRGPFLSQAVLGTAEAFQDWVDELTGPNEVPDTRTAP
jgi:excisionase family DNA binding protein